MADWARLLRFGVLRMGRFTLVDISSYPVRGHDGAWVYRWAGGLHRWRTFHPWMLVPHPLQRAWVHWHNVRFCATRGHDDTMWHVANAETPPEAAARGWTNVWAGEVMRCGNCSVELTGCTGYGHSHRPTPVSEPEARE